MYVHALSLSLSLSLSPSVSLARSLSRARALSLNVCVCACVRACVRAWCGVAACDAYGALQGTMGASLEKAMQDLADLERTSNNKDAAAQDSIAKLQSELTQVLCAPLSGLERD